MKLRDQILWGLVVGGDILGKVMGGGSRAYQTEKLYLWTPPKYTKKKYRYLVGRLYREGYLQRVLIEGRLHFRITEAGRRLLLKSYPALKSADQTWDGFWRLVMFDVPEAKRRGRDDLRKQLLRLGFGKLQNSTYLSCYDHGKGLLDFVKVRDLVGKVILLEAKQKYLGSPTKLAERVWKLDKIAEKYKAVIDSLSTRFGIRDLKKREEFLKRIYQQYLKVLAVDPFLPSSLLPKDWPAEKARKYVLRAAVVREE